MATVKEATLVSVEADILFVHRTAHSPESASEASIIVLYKSATVSPPK